MGVFAKTRRDGTLCRQAGFTLIELMIAVAIIGVAMAIAIPNFARMYIDYEAKATASEITRYLVLARTRAMTSNQTLTVGIVLVNGVVSMTATNFAGAQAFRNGFDARHMAPLVFSGGGIPNGGAVQFDSNGVRTSVPGAGVQTITVGGILSGSPTQQYRINVAPSGIAGLARL